MTDFEIIQVSNGQVPPVKILLILGTGLSDFKTCLCSDNGAQRNNNIFVCNSYSS